MPAACGLFLVDIGKLFIYSTPMPTNQPEKIVDKVISALAQYGATLGIQGQIRRGDKILGVCVVIKGKRIRFESSSSGNLLASGPVAESTVEKFVESFWMWSKQ